MYNLEDNRGFTGTLSKAGLGESAGTANKMKIAAPNGAGCDFAINGIAYHVADADDLVFSAGHTSLAALQTCLFLIQITAAGTISTKQSNIASNDSGTPLRWPQPDANNCALGGLKIRCNNAAVFVPNTTDLGAADVVDTFYDFAAGGPPTGAVAA